MSNDSFYDDDLLDDIYDDDIDNIPAKKDAKKKKTIIISLVSIIAIIAAIVVGFLLYNNRNDNEESSNHDVSQSQEESIDVTPESAQRMSDGTMLSFGSKDPQAKTVTIFASPSDLSREGRIIHGKPSPLLNTIKDKKIKLNIYLSPKDDNESKGTDSMIRAASCKIVQDKSPGSIVTFASMVKSANNFQGSESAVDIAKKMGLGSKLQCPRTSPEAASATANNAMHFMTQYKLDKPNLIVSGDKGVTGFSRLSDDWVQKALVGKSAESFISND